MDSKSINIKEIAALAGVSPSTVSRVINKNGRFSKETEERVQRIIEKYQYTPDMNAKGLRTKKIPVVGIVVPDITNSHFSGLVWHIENTLFEKGYSCIICNTNEQETLEERHINTLVSQNVSGIILVSSTRIYNRLKSIPTVYLDRRPKWYTGNGYLVESDNFLGGYLAGRELIEQGARRVAILRAKNFDYNQISRFEGFKRSLLEFGYGSTEWIDICTNSALNLSGEKEIIEAIKGNKQFDGLMCTTDTLAAGAIIGMESCGLTIPKDCLITGYDDSSLAKFIGGGITTIRQNVKKMAEESISILLQLREKKEPYQKQYVIPVELVRRNSTKLF